MSNTVSSHFQNSPSEFTANLSNKDTIMTSTSNSSIPSSSSQQQQKHSTTSHSIKVGHDSIEIDYESLPENSPIVAQLFAGAFAGIMEHTVMYPIDAIKTRMQASSSSSNQFGKNKLPTGIIASVSRITSLEGTMALWRGVSSVITGAGPAHAVYYMVFESTKTTLCNNLISNRKTNNNLVTDEKHPLIASISGIAATITSDALMTPFDVIKQRMQLNEELRNSSKTKAASSAATSASVAATSATTTTAASNASLASTSTTSSNTKALKSINNSSSKNTLLRTAFQIYKNEGMSTFFISYPTTLILSIPFAAINFGVYEYCSNILNPNQAYNPLLHCVAGGVSGAAAAAVTTPFDCIKTALQTKAISTEPLIKNANGFTDAARALYRIGGYSAFLKGLRPRVVFNVPSTAISWTAYEMAKAYLLTNEFSSSSSPPSKSSPPL
ncbi:unnamed protein product [[Candida] boidinii]|uniref:Unnamed protein product n=1 Tax=Candida boidinii TaxID=5477 RepID=A0A9W6WF26_CANBO|nr:unnamed protein product [[Candida] boidinii]GMG15551.1 unnamed protein product [[Candida] boidinii]